MIHVLFKYNKSWFLEPKFVFSLKTKTEAIFQIVGKTSIIFQIILTIKIHHSDSAKNIHHNCRLNGACLIDEDYLRSEGVTDFRRYRCDPDNEPPRMMPRQFPDLTVAEEEGPRLSKL